MVKAQKDSSIKKADPKFIHPEEEIEDGELVQEVWSKNRVIIGVIVLVLLAGVAGYMIHGFVAGAQRVLGTTTVTTQEELPTREDIHQVLSEAKETLGAITSENFTSSEAAVQKVIQDLEALQTEDAQAKDLLCKVVCR